MVSSGCPIAGFRTERLGFKQPGQEEEDPDADVLEVLPPEGVCITAAGSRPYCLKRPKAPVHVWVACGL